ncbi:MAG: TRAP transporter small permease [Rhodospirillales bacterium]|nr:TRAP transporter small permease [Rhodospirillales bacterium]
MNRGRVDRFIDGIEVTAACFLAVVTALTFVSVFLRYFFNWTIPDTYDFSALLLGILVFWGIAVANYRGDHITVDLVWSVAGRRGKRALDILAALVTLVVMLTFTWMVGTKVVSVRADNVLTYDLRLPVWMFYLVAWAGLAASMVLLTVRTLRLVFRPDLVDTRVHVTPLE